ncbi:uncharacterized protein LOC115305376 [Suricata suricatta]|uniref:uncharacterized protein LOC115305376 n=1 Tax=Suricata suricatta TaxID=37032 RepID=UPI001155DBD6|nr:uncharacterized protein LOC115305376 [Suricata suricatta]
MPRGTLCPGQPDQHPGGGQVPCFPNIDSLVVCSPRTSFELPESRPAGPKAPGLRNKLGSKDTVHAGKRRGLEGNCGDPARDVLNLRGPGAPRPSGLLGYFPGAAHGRRWRLGPCPRRNPPARQTASCLHSFTCAILAPGTRRSQRGRVRPSERGRWGGAPRGSPDPGLASPSWTRTCFCSQLAPRELPHPRSNHRGRESPLNLVLPAQPLLAERPGVGRRQRKESN